MPGPVSSYPTPGRLQACFSDQAACNEFEPELPEGVNSVLVINGSADKMTPARAGMALAASLQGGQSQQVGAVETITIDGSGHSMLSERPNEVLDGLSSHLLS